MNIEKLSVYHPQGQFAVMDEAEVFHRIFHRSLSALIEKVAL
jgi:hypothetical protein